MIFRNEPIPITKYQDLGIKQIIYGIKDQTFKINFIKSYIFIIPLAILIGAFSSLSIFNLLPPLIKIIATIIIFITMIITILAILSQWYQIYFNDTNLILQNKLKKKKIIDIAKYPIIYVISCEHTMYNPSTQYDYISKSYDLYIEQNDIKIKLDVDAVGGNKIDRLINNLEMKSKDDFFKS